MAANVSLPGNGVSVKAKVSLTTVSTALFALKVSLIGGVSLTGTGGGSSPPPPPGQGPKYWFFHPEYSYYLASGPF